MKVRPAPALAVAALLAALQACVGSSDCDTAEDCAATELCQVGVCVPQCTDDRQCVAPRVCDDGVCVVADRCASTTDCPTGEVCEDGTCQPQPAECSADTECPPNFSCCDGGCYPPGSADCALLCRDRGDCEVGFECVDGMCVVPGPTDVREDADVAPDASDAPNDSDADAEDVSPDLDDTTEDGDAVAGDADAGDDATDGDSGPDAPEDVPEDAPGELDEDADDSGETEVEDTDSAPEETVECTFNTDCVAPEVCIGFTCVIEEVADPCEGRADGQLGERCTAASDCCSGYCFGVAAAGRGVCSEACDSWLGCNPPGLDTELFCYRNPGLPSPLCTESDYLASCRVADTCIDQKCLVSRAGGACTYGCETVDDCTPGDACGYVAFGVGGGAELLHVCVPLPAGCRVSSDCLSGTCLVDDDTGVSYCSALCDLGTPGADCPAGFVCQALPDGAGGELPVCVLAVGP